MTQLFREHGLSALQSQQDLSVGGWHQRAFRLLLGAALAVLAVASATVWDVTRRNAEWMKDFGLHQQRLAEVVASSLQARLVSGPTGPAKPDANTLEHLKTLERRGMWVLLLWPPGAPNFQTTDGQGFVQPLLSEAVALGQGIVRLPRDEAARLGLPRRAAVAGLAQFASPPDRRFYVAVVASALQARQREEQARWRMLLAVLLCAGVVVALSGVALRGQRRELRLQQTRAVEEAQRRRENELDRASRAATLGTLAMGITHELSTPLGIVVARAEQLALRVEHDERAAQAARVIVAQAHRMSQVIRGFLSVVRNQTPVSDQLSPAEICSGAVALVQHRFADLDISLRIDLPNEAARPILRGDGRLLEQALVNLLLNACDACLANQAAQTAQAAPAIRPGPSLQPTQGVGRVGLSVRVQENGVLFRVDDDGVGISKEAAAQAMEPFFTTKPAGQGTGLGLAVAREIAKSHRGSLRLFPLGERGTCAEFFLPHAQGGAP